MPPLPPSKRQIASWVAKGLITAEQGESLRRGGRPSPADRTRFLGPAPHLPSTGPAFAGIAGAILVAVACIVLDTIVAGRTKLDPGDLLVWVPSAAAVVMGIAALATHGRPQVVLMAAALSLPCLLTALHPDPPRWMFAVAPAAALLTLVLRLDAPTRMVLAIPALAGIIIVSMGLLETSEQQSVVTMLTILAYLFGVAFAVPFESGWRRAPFALHLALAVTLIGLGIAAAPSVLMNAATGGSGADPGAMLLGATFVIAYPVLTWLLWTRDAARDYQLPTLPEVRALRRPGTSD
jgi:hypothetical protein